MGLKSITQQKEKTYYKHNFVDMVRNLVPNLYIDEDIMLSGVENDIVYDVLEGLVELSLNLSSAVYVSGFQDSDSVRQLFNPAHVSASLTPTEVFKLLNVAGSYKSIRFSDLSVAEQIKRYKLMSIKQAQQKIGIDTQKESLINDVLPVFTLNSPDYAILSALDSSITNTATAHTYMYNNYGWLYVLNNVQVYDSETEYQTMRNILVNKLKETAFVGKDFTLEHGVSGFMEYLRTFEGLD